MMFSPRQIVYCFIVVESLYFTYCKTFLLSYKGDPKDIDDVMAPLFFVAHEIMTSAALSPALVLVSVYFYFICLRLSSRLVKVVEHTGCFGN